jgi:hypothetical protein
MQNIIHSIKQIGFITIALTLALVANFAYGQWANPTATPPTGNIEAPLNTSSFGQVKPGNIGVSELIAATKVRSDQYCDFEGNNCIDLASSTDNVTGDQFEVSEWVEMKESRSRRVWYTNNTGTTIYVSVGTRESREMWTRKDADSPSITIGSGNGDSSDAPYEDNLLVIPAGWQYWVNAAGINYWNELRPVSASICVAPAPERTTFSSFCGTGSSMANVAQCPDGFIEVDRYKSGCGTSNNGNDRDIHYRVCEEVRSC